MNPPPVVPLGRGDIGKPNSTDDDYNTSSRWSFFTHNEGNYFLTNSILLVLNIYLISKLKMA